MSAPELQPITLSELVHENDGNVPFLWEGILPRKGLAAIVGKPDSGKSMLTRHLSLAVASSAPAFLGLPLADDRPDVLFVTTEDSYSACASTFGKQRAGWETIAALEQGYGMRQADKTLRIAAETALDGRSLIESITEYVAKQPIGLVVIDSFGDAFGGRDINSNAEVRAMLKPYAALANDRDLCILFVSHINKAGYAQRPDQVHAQGASAFAQKVRTILDLSKRDERHSLTVTKGNATPDYIKNKPLTLSLDPNTLLYARATAPVQEDIWEELFKEKKTATTKECMEYLKEKAGIEQSRARELISRDLHKLERGVYARSPIEE